VPTWTKAQLFVPMDWDRLHDEVRAGTVAAGPGTGTGAGDVLNASTIRKLACDGGILPTVLGSQGQPLDLGYTRRCFTAGQVKMLWLRDGGCTIPGCSIPAAWCDAHHLVHWADGGPTDLANAALLCGHHHTVVHQRRYAGRVDPGTGRVVWDLATGSYDTALHPTAPCTRPHPRPRPRPRHRPRHRRSTFPANRATRIPTPTHPSERSPAPHPAGISPAGP
jgi:hypothetical protein